MTDEDFAAIREWANYIPSWESQNLNMTFSDPVCYITGCGKPTVTYVDPAAAATATWGPSKFYPVCAEHSGKPWDIYATGRQYARTLLAEIERLRAENRALKDIIAMPDPRIHQQAVEEHRSRALENAPDDAC
jgi:hypothetical protein